MIHKQELHKDPGENKALLSQKRNGTSGIDDHTASFIRAEKKGDQKAMHREGLGLSTKESHVSLPLNEGGEKNEHTCQWFIPQRVESHPMKQVRNCHLHFHWVTQFLRLNDLPRSASGKSLK